MKKIVHSTLDAPSMNKRGEMENLRPDVVLENSILTGVFCSYYCRLWFDFEKNQNEVIITYVHWVQRKKYRCKDRYVRVADWLQLSSRQAHQLMQSTLKCMQ